ncbi:MAG: hypothetical protein ACJA13_000638 [Paraglaciecola sp.]|jgi:hypothetical protein
MARLGEYHQGCVIGQLKQTNYPVITFCFNQGAQGIEQCRRAAFTKYSLYFALRAILRMFKMVPDHFVLVTSFGCRPYLRDKYGTALAGLKG